MVALYESGIEQTMTCQKNKISVGSLAPHEMLWRISQRSNCLSETTGRHEAIGLFANLSCSWVTMKKIDKK